MIVELVSKIFWTQRFRYLRDTYYFNLGISWLISHHHSPLPSANTNPLSLKYGLIIL